MFRRGAQYHQLSGIQEISPEREYYQGELLSEGYPRDERLHGLQDFVTRQGFSGALFGGLIQHHQDPWLQPATGIQWHDLSQGAESLPIFARDIFEKSQQLELVLLEAQAELLQIDRRRPLQGYLLRYLQIVQQTLSQLQHNAVYLPQVIQELSIIAINFQVDPVVSIREFLQNPDTQRSPLMISSDALGVMDALSKVGLEFQDMRLTAGPQTVTAAIVQSRYFQRNAQGTLNLMISWNRSLEMLYELYHGNQFEIKK